MLTKIVSNESKYRYHFNENDIKHGINGIVLNNDECVDGDYILYKLDIHIRIKIIKFHFSNYEEMIKYKNRRIEGYLTICYGNCLEFYNFPLDNFIKLVDKKLNAKLKIYAKQEQRIKEELKSGYITVGCDGKTMKVPIKNDGYYKND